jgi:hypothetical protein
MFWQGQWYFLRRLLGVVNEKDVIIDACADIDIDY